MGSSWGRPGVVLGGSWGGLGVSWGRLWRSWVGVGTLLGRFGRIFKNRQKPKENQGFCLVLVGPGGVLGGLGTVSRRSWEVLEASWEDLGGSWGDLGKSYALLGRLGTILGPSWGRLGAILGPSWGDDCFPAARRERGGGPGEPERLKIRGPQTLKV